jgi:SAM-dependent methyltransferase
MADNDRQKWNAVFDSGKFEASQPARVLEENLHLLPPAGVALDLACGLGANAMLLARQGLETHAWDISDTAIGKLNDLAGRSGLTIYSEQRDVIDKPPTPDIFDLIIVSRFLDRRIVPHIIDALKNKGLLFYQTFTRNKPEDSGPSNPDYLLERNELLRLFDALAILYYREDDQVGRLKEGFRNEAMLVAQKTRSGIY